jgi:hypothetical protein
MQPEIAKGRLLSCNRGRDRYRAKGLPRTNPGKPAARAERRLAYRSKKNRAGRTPKSRSSGGAETLAGRGFVTDEAGARKERAETIDEDRRKSKTRRGLHMNRRQAAGTEQAAKKTGPAARSWSRAERELGVTLAGAWGAVSARGRGISSQIGERQQETRKENRRLALWNQRTKIRTRQAHSLIKKAHSLIKKCE